MLNANSRLVRHPLVDLPAGVVRGAVCLLPLLLSAAWPNEREWQNANAMRYNAIAEVRLWDNTRADFVSESEGMVYEIDWHDSWAQAIGQSLYYSDVTGYRPGIILLVRTTDRDKAQRHIYRCQTVCVKRGIKLVVEEVAEEPDGPIAE